MRMAVDQSTTMNSGEADNRDVALYAHSGQGMAVPKELDVVRSCAGEGCLQRRVTLLVR